MPGISLTCRCTGMGDCILILLLRVLSHTNSHRAAGGTACS